MFYFLRVKLCMFDKHDFKIFFHYSFKYIGFSIEENGDIDDDITHRIGARLYVNEVEGCIRSLT